MFEKKYALLDRISKIQKRLFLIPVVLISFISTPIRSENNDFPEIIADKAIEIMTEGVLLSMEFSQITLSQNSFLQWRALVKFNKKIYSCRIDQMVKDTMDVDDPPITRCKESL